MAGRSLGVLTLDLVAKIGGFEQGMDKAARASSRTSKQIATDAEKAAARTKAAFSSIKVAAMGALAGVSVGAAFKAVIDNTRQMEQEQAQLAAVLKSTGNAAGFTRDELNKMAGALSGKSIFSTGEISQAQTALLAFTGVLGNEFKRAQQSAADMAARTGMSIQQATELIGRALDVPSQGMASLSRQGFRFGDDQKKLMQQFEATGKTAEAQGIILDALEESYKGAALAARQTFGGALDAVRNSLNDLLTGKEGSMDEARLGIEALNTALESPEAAQAFNAVVSSMATGAGVVAKALAAIPWKQATDAAMLLATVMTARFAVAMVASMKATALSTAEATREAVRYQHALAAMAGVAPGAALGLKTMSAAAIGLRSALAFVGGPLGAVLVAAQALVYFASKSSAAEIEAAKLAGRVAKLASNYKELAAQQAPAAITDLNDEIKRLEGELSKANAKTETLKGNLERFPNSAQAKGWQRDLDSAASAAFGFQQEIDGARGQVDHLQRTMDGVTAKPMADGVKSEFAGIGDEVRLATALIGDFTAAQRFAIEASFGKHGNDVEQQKHLAGLYAVQDARRAAFEQQKRADAAARQASSRRASESKASASRAQAEAKRAEEAAKAVIKKAQEEAKAIQDVLDLMLIEEQMLGSSAEAVKVAEYKRKGADDAQLKRYGEALEAVRAFGQAQQEIAQFGDDPMKYITGDVPILSGGLFDEQQQRYEAEAKAEEERYRAQQERLESALLLKQVSIEEYGRKEEEFAIAHAERMAQIEQARHEIMLNTASAAFGGMADNLRDYIQVFGQENKAMVGMMKAASIAQTVIQTYQGAQQAYTSLSAIPVVGPALGTAAAAAAIAGGMARVAAIRSQGISGMAHDGIDSIPQTGTWLLEKGERVTTASTSAKLDATLARIEQGGGKGGDGVTVNVHNAPEGTRVERRQVSDAEFVVDVMISDAAGDGRFTRFNQRTFGLKRQGS